MKIKFFFLALPLLSCTNHDLGYKFAAGHVIVGFKPEVTLEQAADFTNKYADGIGHILGFYYYSNLANDSLHYVTMFVINVSPGAEVRIGFSSNRIEVLNDFYRNEADSAKLNEWLKIVENPVLQFEDMHAGKTMLLYVQPGTEKQWIKTHINDTYLSFAELDYILSIETN